MTVISPNSTDFGSPVAKSAGFSLAGSTTRRTGGSGQTIMIVDDDRGVRSIVAALLKHCGFKTVAAANGLEALQSLEKNPNVDAVLLDVLMPVMDGEETFRHLRQLHPEIRVIVISGLNLAERKERFENPPPDGFMQKPFTMASLTGALSVAFN